MSKDETERKGEHVLTEGQSAGLPFPPALFLLAPLGWWTLRLPLAADPWCFLDYANLAFHEAGHLFLIPFGTTMHYLGGTIGQILVPCALAVWFLFKQGAPSEPPPACGGWARAWSTSHATWRTRAI